MDWQIILVFGLLVLVMLAFFREWASPDVVALSAFGVVLATGVLDVPGALSVFANPAPVTIGAMFVLSAGLEATGCIDIVGRFFRRIAGRSELSTMGALMLLAGVLSAFINNTVVVVVFLPVVMALGREANLNPSRLLIPLSFASILGGTCTLTGTSTNLILDGIAQDHGLAAFSMFEVTKLGIVYAVLGGAYLATIGRKILPSRSVRNEDLEEPEHRGFLTQFSIESDSPLVGKHLTDTLLKEMPEARVHEVRRRGSPLDTPLDKLALKAGDRLLVTLHSDSLEELKESGGIRLAGHKGLDLRKLESRPLKSIEGIISARSRLVGKSIRSANLRRRYGVIVLAVHRQGTELRKDLGDVKLSFGDTLLMEGPADGINMLQRSSDFVTISERETREGGDRPPLLAAAVVVAFVLGATFNILPIVGLAILAAMAMILTGCISARRAYQSVHWDLIFLIIGMLALGKAMEQSQAAQVLVDGVTGLFRDATPYVLLAVIYLLCSVLTELITNNAVAALLAPIVIGIAESLGVDSRPFIVAMMFGCSASFATPIGYQTNTYVYGAGGYRFTDFLRIGVPLNLGLWIVATILIPVLWPFLP